MKYLSTLRFFILLITLLSINSVGFAQANIGERTIRVVTTTNMITDIVKIVGGERVEVTGLMSAGVDPHLYRAKAGDIQALTNADIIFLNGLHLEAKMGEIFQRLQSRIPVYALGDALPEENLLAFPGFPGFHDPHIWFDVSYWSMTIEIIAEGFAQLDPDHAADYLERAQAYQIILQALDTYVFEAVSSIPEAQRLIITAHDAFNYFGNRYDIEVTGLQGVSTEAEAGVQDVQNLVSLIVNRKIPAIFIETSVPTRTIEAVQEATKARGWDVKIGGTLFSDSAGDAGTEEGTYVGMVLHNVAVITIALGGELPSLPDELSDYQVIIDRALEDALITEQKP